MVVKQVYNELVNLSNFGFTTWISHAGDLANMRDVDMYNVGDLKSYIARCNSVIVSNFKQNWQTKLHTWTSTQIMRTYVFVQVWHLSRYV